MQLSSIGFLTFKIFIYRRTIFFLFYLQVSFEGDPEAALVSFASNAQAFAAYKSSEPLFNNRFIKVFFHRSKDKKEQVHIIDTPDSR